MLNAPPMNIAETTTVVVSRNQLSTIVGEETVILQLDDGKYFGLNQVGSTVWQLLQQPRTVGNIKSELLEQYDVTPEQCERDLLHLLAGLVEAGLIEIRNDSPNS
jgi:hypothetical protein